MPKGKTGRKKLGRPPRGKALTIKQIADAIKQSGGFISIAAEQLGITVAGVSQRIKKSEELQKVVDDIEEKRLDLAESKLIANIKANDQRAIEFYIRHKGRRRGYIPVDSHIIETDKPLEIKVTWAK
jgi:hypothetical protein